ncbi:unnamed protein product [Trichobilharzia regenti]|nr:unnamed protein product [Trichobilharzia regenti]
MSNHLANLGVQVLFSEGDRKAFFESALNALAENKKRVSDLRLENTKLRNVLRERLSVKLIEFNLVLQADQHIINHVLHNRQADRVCMANKTGTVAIELMDYRTCDAMKKFNALKHVTVQKEKKIEELKSQYQNLTQLIEDGNATFAGTNKEGKMLRDLENRLDKAQLKHHEAEHIRKTYEQIRERLQDEVSELQQMYNDAILARDAAQRELKFQEEHITSERRRREPGRESLSTEDVQSGSVRGTGTGVGDKTAGLAGIGITEDQQMKIASYEESFKSIKEVTGLSDLDQIVKRFESQGETLRHLNELKDKAEQQCQELRKRRDELQQEFEELKYSGETELKSVNNMLEQYRNEAQAEAERRERCRQNAEDANRLLIECKAGVDHIYDKLSFLNVNTIKSVNEHEDTDSSDIPEMLKVCNEKLDELMDSLSEVNIEEQLNLMEQEEVSITESIFFSKLEDRLPQNNMRIKFPLVKGESVDDDDGAADDNDILTRAALKKQAQQIVEMRNKKRQPKKKKRKAR